MPAAADADDDSLPGSSSLLQCVVPETIWVAEYPVTYCGCAFNSRMTVVKLQSGRLLLHSPCEITADMQHALSQLGPVGSILAPGSAHHLHIPSAHLAFPHAEVFLCPGVREGNHPHLAALACSDLGVAPPEQWGGELQQVLLEGNTRMREVVLFHTASKTLIVVDLVENFTGATPGTSLAWRLLLRLLLGMWERPGPAPEYHLGWRDRAAACRSLEQVLRWDFRRVLLAHGDLLLEPEGKEAEGGARRAVVQAWEVPLLRSTTSKLLLLAVYVAVVLLYLVTTVHHALLYYNYSPAVLPAAENKDDDGEDRTAGEL